MDSTSKTLLCLVQSALTQQPVELPAEYDLEAVVGLAQAHQVEAMAYTGAVLSGISRKEKPVKQLLRAYMAAVVKNEAQNQCLESLFAAFEEAGIDYLPMKGCVVKPLYPQPELRAMNDADVLIKPAQYKAIVPILQAQGYQFYAESNCELKWIRKELYLELHKRLIPSFIKDLYAYFGDGWELAKPDRGHRYALCAEDVFLYLFSHFARHYREGGVGIRHMADVWFYEQKKPELDKQKVSDGLERMGLTMFYRNICATLDHWFADGSETAITKQITDYVISSGSMGRVENKQLAQSVNRGSKLRGLCRTLFPTANQMKYAYPVLKEHPALLPALWVYRGAKTVFTRQDLLKRRLAAPEDEKRKAFEDSLLAVGLRPEYEDA